VTSVCIHFAIVIDLYSRTPLPNRLPVAIANYVSKKGGSCKVYFLIFVDIFNVKNILSSAEKKDEKSDHNLRDEGIRIFKWHND